jgi:hypothetical protein
MFALAAAGALIGATALPGQAATTPGWRAVKVYPAMSELTGVAATAANDAFAVGDQANADGTPISKPDIVSRWDGSTWLTLPQPPATKSYAPNRAGTVTSTVPLPEYCSADSAVTVFQKDRRALAPAAEILMWHGI